MPDSPPIETLRIEKLVYGGDGLARVDGRVVLTPYVLPGELVEVRLQRAKNDLFRGALLKVVEASPLRVAPACPYFAGCGGCHYQHTTYEHQLEQKRAILAEVFRRVGRIELEHEIGVVAGDPWRYRNRTQLHAHNGKVGFFAPGSHEAIAVDHCPIASPKLNDAIATLTRELPQYRGFDTTIELFTNETEVQVNVMDRVPAPVRPLFEELGTSLPIEQGAFRVSRNSFFQVNRFLIDRLVEVAIGEAEGGSALDLYAGVGLFAKTLTGRFREVAAVETGGSAFRDLEFNMQRAGLAVACVKQTAEDYLAALDATPDWIVADPPRAGLGKQVARELLRLRAPRLTIVACDPSTLARDLRVLLDGGYRLKSSTLVDLFPQTYHLETVVQLYV